MRLTLTEERLPPGEGPPSVIQFYAKDSKTRFWKGFHIACDEDGEADMATFAKALIELGESIKAEL